MPKAVWNGVTVAESEKYETVERNIYFPPSAIDAKFFIPSQTHTTCSWKGVANYYHLQVGDKKNEDAAWYYPDPKPEASNIKGYVAFWKGVQVIP